MQQGMRLHYIDWLRVSAFAILILYHSSVAFFPDLSWLVSSPERSPELFLVMMFPRVWRMPLLFFVSGMGTWCMFVGLPGRKKAQPAPATRRRVVTQTPDLDPWRMLEARATEKRPTAGAGNWPKVSVLSVPDLASPQRLSNSALPSAATGRIQALAAAKRGRG